MNFIRVGNQLINLSNVISVEFADDGEVRIEFNVAESDWFMRDDPSSAKGKRAAKGKQPPPESSPLAKYFEGRDAASIKSFFLDIPEAGGLARYPVHAIPSASNPLTAKGKGKRSAV